MQEVRLILPEPKCWRICWKVHFEPLKHHEARERVGAKYASPCHYILLDRCHRIIKGKGLACTLVVEMTVNSLGGLATSFGHNSCHFLRHLVSSQTTSQSSL